jgi:hypothetical protein
VHSFPRAKAEAGVVPRTPHGVADYEPFGERSSVVGTGGPDREEFRTAAAQQDGVIADMPSKHVSIWDIIDRDSQRQVGTGRLRLVCAHCDLRLPPNPPRKVDPRQSIDAGSAIMFPIPAGDQLPDGNLFRPLASNDDLGTDGEVGMDRSVKTNNGISSRPSASKSSQTTNRPSRAEVEHAVSTLIRWAGDDPDREGLIETPARVARAYEQWFAGYGEDPEEFLQRTFEEVAGYDEMVLLRDIRFVSHCEHHMAPIIGRAHIGYLPHNRVVGISKLARLVDGLCQAASNSGESPIPWSGSSNPNASLSSSKGPTDA